jgi:hypothetical protein
VPTGDLAQHRAKLGRLRNGRYAEEMILDYLENKPSKAVYITQGRIIYVDLERQSLRWALSFCNLFSVTTAGVKATALHFCNVQAFECPVALECGSKNNLIRTWLLELD